MKNVYSFTNWLLAVALSLATASLGRAQTWAPASPVTVCPGQTGTYTLSGIPAGARISPGKNPGFVSGGTLSSSTTLSNCSITYTVLWDDTPNGGKLTANIEVPASFNPDGTVASYKDIDKAVVARIRSVAGQPGPGGSVSIPVCSTAPLTLSVPTEYFVNVPNEAIPAYLWEVPAGWGVQGATLIPSFASTPGNFRLYQGTGTITLTPTPGGTVDLRVFQYSGTCNQTYFPGQPYRLLSFPGAYRVLRDPSVAITAGPTSLYCGERSPVTYTAAASQSAGAVFGWTYPSTWTVQGSATGSSIVLVPDGVNGGNVSVQALYTCGGPNAVAVATAPPRNVFVRPEAAPPAITTPGPQPYGAAYPLCGPTTFVATAGAQSYRWTTTWGDDFVTTTNTATITPPPSPTGPGYASGYGTVRVRAQNATVS